MTIRILLCSSGKLHSHLSPLLKGYCLIKDFRIIVPLMSSSVHRWGVATSRPPRKLRAHNGQLGQLEGVPNNRAAAEDTWSKKSVLEGCGGADKGRTDTQSLQVDAAGTQDSHCVAGKGSEMPGTLCSSSNGAVSNVLRTSCSSSQYRELAGEITRACGVSVAA